MKKTNKIIALACVLIITLNFLTVISAAGGTGTETDPFIITTAEELQNINNNVSAHYKLGANIDLKGMDFVPLGNADSGAFSGSFDGNGFTIKNLDVFSGKFAGLFGSNEGIIKNVILENIYVYGTRYIGGVVAHNTSFGTIENCKTISGLVETDGGINNIQIGGICGLNEGAFNGSFSNGADIEATDSDVYIYAGGVCGYWNSNEQQEIIDSYNTGNISSSASSDNYYSCSGGLMGYIHSTLTLINCNNTGNIATSYGYSGGLVGKTVIDKVTISESYNSGKIYSVGHFYQSFYDSTGYDGYSGGITGCGGNINNCYNTGYIVSSSTGDGTVFCGGISGSGETINNCYNTGNVFTSSKSNSADMYAGGVSGHGGNITNCYNAGNISSVVNGKGGYASYIGGIVGSTASASLPNCYTLKGSVVSKNENYSGNYLSDAEMKKQSSYMDWDFIEIWAMDSKINNGYPVLKTTASPLTLNTSNKIMLSGSTLQLKAYKNGVVTNDVTWSVSSGSATVSSTGLVTAGSGLATVTATDRDGNKANFNTYIIKKASSLSATNRTINLSQSKIKNSSYFTVNGSDTDYVAIYQSSDTSVLKVDAVGRLTPLKVGTVAITAITAGGVSATQTVTVEGSAKSISIPIELIVGVGSTEKITVTTTPEPTTSVITWTSSDESVATVDSEGNITGLKIGSAIITATTDNGLSSSCAVTVNAPITEMAFETPSLTLYRGETYKLKLNITPTYTTDTITYSTSSSSKASVSSTGLVTVGTSSSSTGTVTITATSSSGQKAYCNITIKSWPSVLTTVDSTTSISNRYIMTDADLTTKIKDLVVPKTGYSVTATPSQSAGGKSYFGTGSTVDVYDEYGNLVITYTLIVKGDLTGDSVCDVLDTSAAYLYLFDFYEANELEAYAANGCISDVFDTSSYQNVVNMCLAS